MAINAVGGNVQRPILKPFDAEIGFVKTRIFHFGKGRHPVEPLGLFAPEGIWIANGLRISIFIA